MKPGKVFLRMAVPNEVTNVFPLMGAFRYKGKKKKNDEFDYTIILKDDKGEPFMLTNWDGIKEGEFGFVEEGHNSKIHDSLRSKQKINYHAFGKHAGVYMLPSQYGYIPQILPILEPTLVICSRNTSKAKNKYTLLVNSLNNSVSAGKLREKGEVFFINDKNNEKFKGVKDDKVTEISGMSIILPYVWKLNNKAISNNKYKTFNELDLKKSNKDIKDYLSSFCCSNCGYEITGIRLFKDSKSLQFIHSNKRCKFRKIEGSWKKCDNLIVLRLLERVIFKVDSDKIKTSWAEKFWEDLKGLWEVSVK